MIDECCDVYSVIAVRFKYGLAYEEFLRWFHNVHLRASGGKSRIVFKPFEDNFFVIQVAPEKTGKNSIVT